MYQTFDERSLREQTIKVALNLINMGYRRETIIRMIIAEGFGENYATSVTDEAFARMSENYGSIGAYK